ncbi:citryl-CoA lyase [Haloprofundus marisrubri]|uniref:Citryl-CoA lyase n=1 Tax=Haloprofundus marisrubri TaxID=1514971 RepID=A0A0W1RAZ7_9EURY|nr:CoA ester lyase [Haloprofundus marisrubri]KTG10261.1 citryl-CoA lyase [Haloprofundus marisrubri]
MSRRSVLFSPGDRPELMRKAPNSDADTIVFDLEDAVSPARKDEAREEIRTLLSDPEFDPEAEVCVRLADPASDLGVILEDDDVRLDAVMLPKVSAASDVERTAELLAERGHELPVLALIENAAGVLAAEDIAAADATDALAFGAEDLAADIGATRTEEATEVLFARQHVILAASAAGVDALDMVFTDFSDSEGLAEETAFGLTLGYDGKLVIHPAQVPVVNDAFTPSDERIEWARKVVAAKEEADDEGRGVFEVDGEMIDGPLVTQAERVLARAEAAGRI